MHQWRQNLHKQLVSCSVAPPPLLCRQDMEQQLGSLILATDISRQNEFLTTFREHLDNQDLDLRLAAHRHFILQVQQRHHQTPQAVALCAQQVASVTSAMCLQIALKCADVCNPCRVWELSRQWSERVCEEFYRQGESQAQTFAVLNSPDCCLQAFNEIKTRLFYQPYVTFHFTL